MIAVHLPRERSDLSAVEDVQLWLALPSQVPVHRSSCTAAPPCTSMQRPVLPMGGVGATAARLGMILATDGTAAASVTKSL